MPRPCAKSMVERTSNASRWLEVMFCDEHLVDLQFVRRQLLQIGERGKARPVIVDGDADAVGGEELDILKRRFRIVDDRRFRDFKADLVRRLPHALRPRFVRTRRRSSSRAEMLTASVSGKPAALQLFLFFHGALQHPVGQRAHMAGFLRHRHEQIRRDGAARWVASSAPALSALSMRPVRKLYLGWCTRRMSPLTSSAAASRP